MQNIYVVTHAQSEHHVTAVVGGWYDTGLTNLGKVQATKVANKIRVLTSESNIRLISSDLKRAAKTASIIGNSIGVETALDAGFRENSYGIAEGKPQHWLNERIVAAPIDNRLDHKVIEGAESKREFVTRIYASMSNLPTDRDVVIVTHGYALTFIISHWIGLTLEQTGFVNFSTKPASITHLQDGGFFSNKAVKYLSDTSHLTENSV